MANFKRNETAKDFWKQVFAREARRQTASLWDPAYDPSKDDERTRAAYIDAGWSEEEAEWRVRAYHDAAAGAEEPNSGVNPGAQVMYKDLCRDVEAAMARFGLASHETVAHGIEPRIGPFAAKLNVVMTDESVITVGVHLFRYCGLIARAFTRTLWLNPYMWSAESYVSEEGAEYLAREPTLIRYWAYAYLSYAVTGTNLLAPFKPSRKHELILMEQVARSMEIFAIAHEYGHHHLNHGRSIAPGREHDEEFEADQFALRICREVERHAILMENPYLPSGAGGAILLLSLRTLGKVESLIAGSPAAERKTHPHADERVRRFDSVAALEPARFLQLKQFRDTAVRILNTVESFMIAAFQAADFKKLCESSDWKFRDQT